ncbi:type II toxin-antitoxin system VapC family toxin [Caulobacter sp. RL271]|uniref:Type II toxin-antitoxin system VapC family toxin n=1 Tax=Caulobacter segnis TaxID=88688 RepID=A0ABY4ZSA9_9CAUL|nr:type II toxin-antitoxin system VapC family toxin [Caulobacter segnis]USQ95099.1 type II toxin-antitoxin system VapC family toxin [Caulobacter segnis]
MRLLLDTHIALWSLSDDPRLSTAARALILEPANEICVSAVTLWEIAIKHGLGRTGPNAMPISAAEAQALFVASGYSLIAITPEQAVLVGTLPPIHADPFDRLLVAQGLTEGLRLVTHDAVMAAYNERIFRV